MIQLDQVIYAPLGSLLIGSQLSTNSANSSCRIAFYAKLINVVEQEKLSSIRIYKPKLRTAIVDRVVDEYQCIGTNLLEKGGNVIPVNYMYCIHYSLWD